MKNTIFYFFKLIGKFSSKIGLAFSFSSDGEDLILSKILGGIKNGKYIDIGSHYPIRHSNTFLFYLKNWSGICIDPLPELKSKYKILRGRDLFLNVGISHDSKVDNMIFYYFKRNPDNSTFDKERVNDLKNLYGRTPSEKIKIKLVSIKEIVQMRTFIEFDSTIHLLNLDIEGFEKEILVSFFSEKIFPWVICVEDLGFLTDDLDKSEIDILMKKNNYALGMKTFLSSIYIYKPSISKLKSPYVKEWKFK